MAKRNLNVKHLRIIHTIANDVMDAGFLFLALLTFMNMGIAYGVFETLYIGKIFVNVVTTSKSSWNRYRAESITGET